LRGCRSVEPSRKQPGIPSFRSREESSKIADGISLRQRYGRWVTSLLAPAATVVRSTQILGSYMAVIQAPANPVLSKPYDTFTIKPVRPLIVRFCPISEFGVPMLETLSSR
jgi:hypothetical protein